MALDAMAFAEAHHSGTRKDGVTPEFAHQVAIAHFVRTLTPHLIHPQETLAIVFLHDVREDYDIADIEIVDRFGPIVAAGVDAMTKEFHGQRRAPHEVFSQIASDPCASVAKAADRIHNQQSMLGVFTPAKIASYLEETQVFFLPMLREARRAFPSQEGAYENAKLVLTSQLHLLSAIPGLPGTVEE